MKLVEAGNQQYTAGSLQVTASTCQCMHWKSMKLPCRHIFAVRQKLGMQLYEESLCDSRWSIEYYKASQRVLSASEEDAPSGSLSVLNAKASNKVLSQVSIIIIE